MEMGLSVNARIHFELHSGKVQIVELYTYVYSSNNVR